MNSITKEVFISTIDSLQAQVSRDIAASNAISQVFDTDAVYDNSLLVKAVIKLLQIHFPKDENGFCEIEHYCFDMNFGKIQGEELVTAEDLWCRLNMEEVVVGDCLYKFTPWEMLNDPIEVVDGASDFIPTKKFRPKCFLGMTSTHPLIDDNLNQDGV